MSKNTQSVQNTSTLSLYGMPLKVFRCGQWNGIEEFVIFSILRQHDIEVIDLENDLKSLPDNVLHGRMNKLLEGTESYFLPSVPLERMRNQPYLHWVTLFRRDAANMPVMLQVASLPQVSHRLSRWENMVSYFVEGGIPAMRAHGATDNDLREIPFKDRRLRGIPISDDYRAANILCNFAEHPTIVEGNHDIYAFAGEYHDETFFKSEGIRTAILDHLVLTHETRTLTVIFATLARNGIVGVKALTNQANALADARLTFLNHFYTWKEGEDERTGFKVFTAFTPDACNLVPAKDCHGVANYFGYTKLRDLENLV